MIDATPLDSVAILDWYRWLPKGAQAKLSLYHLHTLAKMIRDERAKDHPPSSPTPTLSPTTPGKDRV